MNATLQNKNSNYWNQDYDNQSYNIENQLIQNGLNDVLQKKTSTHDEVKKRFALKFCKNEIYLD